MKHANTGRNYAILTKLVKVEHEKKPELNLKSMQIVGFQQASTKFLRFSVQEKKLLWKPSQWL